MNLNDAIKLLSRLPKNPLGVYDELKVRWELHREQLTMPVPSYQPKDFEEIILEIENFLQIDLHKYLTEPDLVEIEEKIQQGINRISTSKVPFPLVHNGDTNLGRLCYIVCRALKPTVFLETGVAYGVTSSFILQALKINKLGRLFSVDRPPVTTNAASFIGALIPEDLRLNWQLYRGVSQKLLPEILPGLKKVDIFLHDSRHTYGNMSSEFKLIAPYLAEQSILIADDINRNIAFQEWVTQSSPDFWATMSEKSKESLIGISLFHENRIKNN